MCLIPPRLFNFCRAESTSEPGNIPSPLVVRNRSAKCTRHPGLDLFPTGVVGLNCLNGSIFGNLIHGKAEPGSIGSIDDQGSFQSFQDNILRRLALHVPGKIFSSINACS